MPAAWHCTLSDHQWKLTQSVAEIGAELPWQDNSTLYSLLCKYHNVCIVRGAKQM